MKKLNIIFFVFIFFNVNAQKANKIFLENLIVFENLKNDENTSFNLNKVYEAREFLFEVTEIRYEIEKSFEMPILPPDQTVKDWRNWYENNKKQLFWDKKFKKVKVRK